MKEYLETCLQNPTNPIDAISQDTASHRVGHPAFIADGPLRGNRERLRSLLEATWFDVGWSLHNIKKSADVCEALKCWNGEHDIQLVQLLLRPTASRIHVNTLRRMYRDCLELKEGIRTAHDEQFDRQESVKKASEALAVTSDADRDRISDILAERREALARAEAAYAAKIANFEAREKTLNDGFAYFARTELVDFCTSQRYTLTPLSVANALAGLPHIGWRQSMKRCAKWKLQNMGSGQYLAVQAISSIVNSCDRRPKLVEEAEKWLRERLPRNARAIVELAENWYYLRQAFKIAAAEPEVTRKQLPYRVAQVYHRMKMHPSAADILLAEGSRLRA